jgi:hypothetical protein
MGTMVAVTAAAARNASPLEPWYSGSQTSGATAVPANLAAANTETAPARLAGTASNATVFRPAQSSADPAPASSHNAA